MPLPAVRDCLQRSSLPSKIRLPSLSPCKPVHFLYNNLLAALPVRKRRKKGDSSPEKRQVAEAGGAEIESGTVNGLPCISYEYDSNLCCSFTTQMGYILEVTVGPAADDDAKLAASVILASIQSEE